MCCINLNKFSSVFLLLCILCITGCAGGLKPETLPSAADRLVAKDFAQIVSQVERYSPELTTFLVPKPIGPVDPFDLALREELTIAGYNFDSLSFNSDISNPVLSHKLEQTSTGNGEVRTYTVLVNNVNFRRGYAIDSEGRVRPITTMQAKGIESEGLRQDDSIFGADFFVAPDTNNSNTSVLSADTTTQSSPEPIGEELIVIPPVVDATVGSDSENLLQGTRIVDESLLVFNDRSLILGEANKRRVVRVLEKYNSRSDVFSLLGCVPNEDLDWAETANELTLGRTERIRSELRYAGIPDSKIKTQKCLQEPGAEVPELPANSVLLILNRSEP